MAYTTTQLVTNAWYLAGILGRNLQTVTADQLSDGLNMLNAVLAIKSADKKLIPYYTVYDFAMETGVETYYIPNLIEVDTLTFFINTVRYSMMPVSRRQYFGSGRVNDINSLPFNYYVNRKFGGADVSVYYLPDNDYPAEIVGKFSLVSVALGQDLSTTIDAFYLEYLRYALADYMCEEYKVKFLPEAKMRLKSYEAQITDIMPLDLTMTKLSSLQTACGLKWGDVNFGHGWTIG